MTIIENKLPLGTYHYEKRTFESDDVDSVKRQYESLGFFVERLEEISPHLYEIRCAIPWNKRNELLGKIRENQACDIER